MSDTRALLDRITAFRERLEQVPRLLPLGPADPGTALAAHPARLAHALRQLAADPDADTGPAPVLTVRARHLLEQARDLVAAQRDLGNDPLLAADAGEPGPLAGFHRSTVALTDTALRLVRAFPDSAETQLRLCDGLEAMLAAVRDRLGIAKFALHRQRTAASRIDRLARLLSSLAGGTGASVNSFAELGDELLTDARNGVPVRFLSVDPADGTADAPAPARFVAAAALSAAQVAARVAPHDYEWAGRPLIPVVAALLMDVGMVRIPPSILGKTGPLDPAERRLVERHPEAGAELVRRLVPDAGPLADAVAGHHERPDGTGYPDGLRGDAVGSLARLLAVCAEYAGRASDRPHRPAHDPRAALTDTLLGAEQGRLDRDVSEYLLALSFHPVGTVVELTDGRLAVVVATHNSRTDLRLTARPVVAVLAGPDGEVLPRPEVLDLAAAERGGIARALSTAERHQLLADRYPDLC